MQFMADVHLPCEDCNGHRFKAEILEVEIQDKSISDILECTIDEAIEFFRSIKQTKIAKKLQPLQDVGLGYAAVGQSSSTLSGGEAQRKIATSSRKEIKQVRRYSYSTKPPLGCTVTTLKKCLLR